MSTDEDPFQLLQEHVICHLRHEKVGKYMKSVRSLYLGPFTGKRCNGGRVLLRLIALKIQELETKASRTDTEDAFLTVLSMPLRDNTKDELSNEDEAKSLLMKFVRELCKTVQRANKNTNSSDRVDSHNYELAEYLLATIFAGSQGVKKDHFADFMVALNESADTSGKADVVISKALKLFLEEALGPDKNSVDLSWMLNTKKFDRIMTTGVLGASYPDIKALFVNELLYRGAPPELGSSDKFLDDMLRECGATRTSEEEELVSDDAKQLESAKTQIEKLTRCTEKLVRSPSAENWSRLLDAANLSSDLKDKSKALGQDSTEKELLHKILADLVAKFDWSKFLAAAVALDELHGGTEYMMRARSTFLDKCCLGDTAATVLDELSEKISAAKTTPLGKGVDTLVSDTDGPSFSDDNSHNEDEFPMDSESGSGHQDMGSLLKSLFTKEGVQNSSLHRQLLEEDERPGQEVNTGALWRCQTGTYLDVEKIRLVYCFGEGTESSVWAALYGDRWVAIKVLLVDKDDYCNYFFRSTCNWIKVNGCEHILQFLGYAHVHELGNQTLPGTKGNKKIVIQAMEICKCDLDDWLNEKKQEIKTKTLPVEQYNHVIAVAFKRIAKGWAELENEGIIHRDLKPTNVLVSSNGTMKLGDFGIARCRANLRDPIADKVGWYMPHEQELGQDLDTSADGYAIGLMLIESVGYKTKFEDIRRERWPRNLNQDTLKEIKKYQNDSGATLLEIGEALCQDSRAHRLDSKALLERLEQWLVRYPLDDSVKYVRTKPPPKSKPEPKPNFYFSSDSDNSDGESDVET